MPQRFTFYSSRTNSIRYALTVLLDCKSYNLMVIRQAVIASVAFFLSFLSHLTCEIGLPFTSVTSVEFISCIL